MKPYNIEIFDSQLNFKANTVVSECKYKYDYLDPEKFKIELLPDVPVGLNDYIHIMRDSEDYIGIVSQTDAKEDGTIQVTVKDVANIFDVDILIDTEAMTGSLEQYLADRLDELFVHNTDSSMNIPATITTSSTTTDWSFVFEPENAELTTKAKVKLFDDLILPAFTAYGIVISIGISLNSKSLEIKIGKNTAPEIVIESDLPNVISKNVVIQLAKKQINKVIVWNTDDWTTNVTYYLHPDGTFDTIDSDRITPVEYSIEEAKETKEKDPDTQVEETIPFADNAYLKASQVFEKNKYDNYIELEILSDDDLIHPERLKIGQTVNVLVGNNSYSSILTGREVENTTTLIFGTIRLELTKILKGRA